jgi:hypothetical protein
MRYYGFDAGAARAENCMQDFIFIGTYAPRQHQKRKVEKGCQRDLHDQQACRGAKTQVGADQSDGRARSGNA